MHKEGVMKENDVKSEAAHKRRTESRMKEENGRKEKVTKETERKMR
jgi:hypothetical protein